MTQHTHFIKGEINMKKYILTEETKEYWLAWENKVIENHYDDIVKIEEEEE